MFHSVDFGLRRGRPRVRGVVVPSPPSFSSKTHARLLDLAWSLAPLSNRDELTRASAEAIQGIIGADEVLHHEIDLASGRVAVRVYPDEMRSIEETNLFASVVSDHPVSRHLARRPEAVPILLTDLLPIRELQQTEAYNVLLRPRGLQFQLILPLRVYSGDPLRVDGGGNGRIVNGGNAFAVSRARSDFSKEAVETALGLQLILGAVYASIAVREPTAEQIDTARRRAGLTERELEILSLVNAGMTATAIGHAKQISPTTVRKHLQNVYTKLGLHDRLAVVTYCRSAGLLNGDS